MEFFAVGKHGVAIYSLRPGETPPSEPDFLFPAVSTADGCVWSNDGTLLALADSAGGVSVHNAAGGYAKLCQATPLIGGPIRNFYFSPLATFLVTHERFVKDAGDNVGLWEAKTGKLLHSFMLKKMTEMTWPPLKWTTSESHCCRMVLDGVLILDGSMQQEEPLARITAPGIMAFEPAPRGAGTGPPHVAICIAESKGAPARCQIFRLDDPTKATASKNFFKAQTVTMQWNNTGSGLLVRTSIEVDDTGKSYYGGANLYFMAPGDDESSIVACADEGPIHDVAWNPTQDEFLLLHGSLPCSMTIYDGKKARKKMDFGSGHRNTIRWNTFGRFLAIGGHGQLIGDTDFWDKTGKKLLGSVRMECCVVCSWGPDGRHFLAATTAPRMRVDNKIIIHDYCGTQLCRLDFEELMNAGWRPRPRGAFQDRPPSPGRGSKESKIAAPDATKQAYRPPGARGQGGGLSELLRKELGSTAAETVQTAVKIPTGPAFPSVRLPPGATMDDVKQSAAANSRNARLKKAKEAKEAAEKAAEQEKLVAALSPSHQQAEAQFHPPREAAAAPADETEIEKRVRALRKKIRDIEKLKEKDPATLDPLQKQKIQGEAELIQQIRALGAEP